jgi:hypothetical protein
LQHTNRDDLEAGLHPFLTTKAKPAELTCLKQRLKDYDTMMSGDSAPTLLDLHTFKDLEQLIFANDVLSFLYSLKGMQVMLDIMFPAAHSLLSAWNLLVQAVNTEQENHEKNSCALWTSPVPQFSKLVTFILLSVQWHPKLPVQYTVT